MALRTYVTRDAGHPWDRRPGFDILELEADTQSELDAAVKEATQKHWQPWIIGTSGANNLPGGAMYKPCDAQSSWSDSPNQRHPGNIRKSQDASIEM